MGLASPFSMHLLLFKGSLISVRYHFDVVPESQVVLLGMVIPVHCWNGHSGQRRDCQGGMPLGRLWFVALVGERVHRPNILCFPAAANSR